MFESRTWLAGLRVSPGLAAAGFQEMRPALALDVASMGDGVTGINRADTASVKLNSILRDPASDCYTNPCVSKDRTTDPSTSGSLREFLAGDEGHASFR